jgi:hypothetical protein
MTKEALKLALEALEADELDMVDDGSGNMVFRKEQAITAIKEALAQPEQEPVGKFAKFTDGIWREVTDGSAGVPLYTTPQRTWVGLTDEERSQLVTLHHGWNEYGQAIEDKLKEINT